MEWFFVFVIVMVILALIRIWNGPKDSKNRRMGSNEHMHYWVHTDAGISDGGGGIDSSSSTDSGGDSFDGGSSDGGGGDSSGF